MVECPICGKAVREIHINSHIDSGCTAFVDEPSPPRTQPTSSNDLKASKHVSSSVAGFFTPAGRRTVSFRDDAGPASQQQQLASSPSMPSIIHNSTTAEGNQTAVSTGSKRSFEETQPLAIPAGKEGSTTTKRLKNAHAPLAERMRPQSLDDVAGQELVGPNGVLRNLILTDRVPSMILWGGPGTGKTTIARLIARTAGARFVEINSTSSGVAECKRLFAVANNEAALTGRKTIIFCDEIHRFSKSQQDVFLAPVEAGQVTLIGATTENPSFKVVNALLSRCRTFTLAKLSDESVFDILRRAYESERVRSAATDDPGQNSLHLLVDDEFALLHYLAAFADGDARTALNLLELALDLCQKANLSVDDIKSSLTKTLVYDRAGDQHYDTISAFHKSVRGSNADAALYYLARMLQSGEDPLYIARRMVVIASEDVGLADNSMLSLATATYTAAEKIGMPECRIALGHCTVALCLAPKSVRAYRGLNAAFAALQEPGVASLPIPYHIRNAPTKLMKDLGYGKEYKYNPDYVEGKVRQEYLPEKLVGRVFLGTDDLGDKIDPDVSGEDAECGTDGDVECEGAYYYNEAGELLLDPDGD